VRLVLASCQRAWGLARRALGGAVGGLSHRNICVHKSAKLRSYACMPMSCVRPQSEGQYEYSPLVLHAVLVLHICVGGQVDVRGAGGV
jgi:hypothetical protein